MKKFKLKKLLLLLPLAALFVFSGCMTPQVELRMEYDKMTIAMLSSDAAAYSAVAGNGDVKAALDYIYETAQATKAMIIGFSQKTKAEIDAVNPGFFLMQSIPSGDANQSAVTEFPYYIKDVKLSVMTMGFKVTETDGTHMTADAHFMLTVTGTATDSAGNVKKDGSKKDITYTAMVILLDLMPVPAAPISLNLHWYKISNDSDPAPVYNLIYGYEKTGETWRITSAADSGKDIVTMEELAKLMGR